MNPGKQTIEWLYREQLKVDDKWAMLTPNGFKWWADQQAQTIEVIGEENDPDGDIADLISVRTEFLRDVDLTDGNVDLINTMMMSVASMAGYEQARALYQAKKG